MISKLMSKRVHTRALRLQRSLCILAWKKTKWVRERWLKASRLMSRRQSMVWSTTKSNLACTTSTSCQRSASNGTWESKPWLLPRAGTWSEENCQARLRTPCKAFTPSMEMDQKPYKPLMPILPLRIATSSLYSVRSTADFSCGSMRH